MDAPSIRRGGREEREGLLKQQEKRSFTEPSVYLIRLKGRRNEFVRARP